MTVRPTLTGRQELAYGGDYNPEQWPRETWREDARLMRAAGVNLVTVGVFSWATLEPEPGRLEWDWLDEVLDLLHEHGIAVDLAVPSASPPPWLARLHPESSAVDDRGVRMSVGSRNHFCPGAPAYRERVVAIARALAARYGQHPAVVLWHVGNELGQACWCDLCAGRFRDWLRARYADLDGLNEAWGTTFWSQRYADWSEVVPPRAAPYVHNPAQLVDFRRFTSDQLRDVYRLQAAELRRVGSLPVTTNFMGFFPLVDQHAWADDLDVVADDHYGDPEHPTPARSALTHDLTRGVRRGQPWILMEQAASAVSWRPHNLPKTPEQMLHDSLRAVAHGADAVCHFQWRQSAAGSEQFHSAMLPHAGPDTVQHRAVVRQGELLRRLAPVAGTRVDARVALVVDWPSLWASELPARPSERLRALDQLEAYHRPLWEDGVATDVVPPGADLDAYDLVVVPALQLVDDAAAANLARVPARGGVLLVGPFCAVQDEATRVRTGPFPVPWAGVLGVAGEDWRPLPAQGVPVRSERYGDFTAHTWSERVAATDAEVLATYGGAGLDGEPAVLRRVGSSDGTRPPGEAWYVSTLPPADVLGRVVRDCAAAAGVRAPLEDVPEGVEAALRGDVLFLLNATPEEREVTVPGAVTDLLGGDVADGRARLGPGGACAVVLAPRGSADATREAPHGTAPGTARRGETPR